MLKEDIPMQYVMTILFIDNIVYFGEGDLCVSIYDLTKSFSDFPLGFYEGLEIFIDIDVANDRVKELMPDFDLIELYESLEKVQGYRLFRANSLS